MKGQWICLSTILLLNRLTETVSFMVMVLLSHWVQSLLDKDLSCCTTTRTGLLEMTKRKENRPKGLV